MAKLLAFLFAASLLVGSAGSQEVPDNFVLVEGGTVKNSKSNYHGKDVTMTSFYIGKYEVTQKEWTEAMGNNPSQFKGDDLPVESVSWYDCVEYCNRRSTRKGLEPYYNIDKSTKDPNNQTVIDDMKLTVTINAGANGYRLPTEAEWEYAAGGGQLSKSYIYSGGDDVNKVAWYWQNAGDEFLVGAWHWSTIERNNNTTKPVGGKEANELALHDMSGNVREWCWDWYGESISNATGAEASSPETGRVWKGGGWIGGDYCCELAFRSSFEASGRGPDQGFRVCRGK
jgi:formylglycine-generating enzyme